MKSTLRRKHLLLVLVIIVAAVVLRSGRSMGADSDQAATFFQAGQWAQAAAAYDTLTRSAPADGQAWFRLGFSRFRLERYEEALAAFEQASDNGVNTVNLMATAAVCEERIGERKAAMKRLRDAVEQGLPSYALRNNPALAFAKTDDGFAALVKRADEVSYPCRNDPMSRQFDFWIGDWEVSAGGSQAGRNVITTRHEGCLILEDYTTPSGYSGQSFNFYDPAIEKWRQIWIDSGGNVTWYEGTLVDAEMRFEGESVPRAGPKLRSRMTFTPNTDGSVRQFVERSADGGKTWTVGFDGRYVKKK